MGKEKNKQVVDSIITADFVLTMDEAYTIHAPGAVAVKGDSIVAVGEAKAITGAYKAQ